MLSSKLPKPTGNRSVVTVAVSMEPALVVSGRANAKARRQSFSAYLCGLLDADLAKVRRKSASPVSHPITTEAA